MDNNLLPIIFQHVRELAEVHLVKAESDRYKLITPFPPVANDFIDFKKEDLEFTDPQTDSDLAKTDTINAYEFFNAVDSLYYDYSYGIKSQEYFLSQVCKNFYAGAIFSDSPDTNFIENFKEKKNDFSMCKRKTVGDLGQNDFYYTSLSPVQWNNGKVVLGEGEISRLKDKALAVYNSVIDVDNEFIEILIADINAARYSAIEYEFGFFDVIRQWVDPRLFESNSWKFEKENEALYGSNDADFTANNTRLCFAERFYIVRNYSGNKADEQRPASGPVAVHRPGAAINPRPTSHSKVRDHRTNTRNELLKRRSRPVRDRLDGKNRIKVDASITTHSDPTGKFIWVNDHWERRKANTAPVPKTDEKMAVDSVYKIAAVTCRIIPWKPSDKPILEKAGENV
jgi:hypothetical protein